MTTFSPRSFSRSSPLDGRLALRAAALGLGLALAACGSGGGGAAASQTGDGAPTPYRSEFLALQGTWHVVATNVSYDDPNGVQIALGIESNVIDLTFFDDDPLEGSIDTYYAGYRTAIPGLDMTSPSFGAGMATVAIAQMPTGPADFQLVGNYYNPTLDMTVAFGPTAAPWSPFANGYAFQIYAGQQIESVQVNEPGVDDDKDGIIDEADEFTLFDQIAPTANMMCSGTMTLSFSR